MADRHSIHNSSNSTLADAAAAHDLEKGIGAEAPQVGPNGSVAPAVGSTDPPAHSAAEAEAEKALHGKSDAEWEVKFAPDDPSNPMSLSFAFKCWLTFLSGILVLNASFASSVPSASVASTMREFGIADRTVGTLIVSIFVLGYWYVASVCVDWEEQLADALDPRLCSFGPLAWGPLSETYGRRSLFVIAFAVYTIFNILCALTDRMGGGKRGMAALLIFRFLGGVCASNPMTNSGGVLGDVWSPAVRGTALSAFVVGPFAGPALGPIVGGYMTVAGVHWTWIYWVLAIFSFVCLVAIYFGLPETYAPLLLAQEAKKLRQETGHPYWAPLDRKKSGVKARLNQTLVGPFRMLAEEPMLLSITLYMSFIYGVLYLDFVAYPIIFEQGHGMTAGSEGLMCTSAQSHRSPWAELTRPHFPLIVLPLFIGACLAALVNAFWYNPRYVKASAAFPPWQAPPELVSVLF